MPTIYRIQDVNGHGPFKPGFSKLWVVDRQDLENLPSWMIEFHFETVHQKIKQGEFSGSGCKTLKQLRRWFIREEYENLQLFGYRTVKLSVDRILAQSAIQCVFARKKPLSQDFEIVNLY